MEASVEQVYELLFPGALLNKLPAVIYDTALNDINSNYIDLEMIRDGYVNSIDSKLYITDKLFKFSDYDNVVKDIRARVKPVITIDSIKGGSNWDRCLNVTAVFDFGTLQSELEFKIRSRDIESERGEKGPAMLMYIYHDELIEAVADKLSKLKKRFFGVRIQRAKEQSMSYDCASVAKYIFTEAMMREPKFNP